MSAVEEFAKHLAGLDSQEKINAALAQARLLSVQSVDQSIFEPPIRTLGQYLSDPIEVPPVLVEPYIAVRGGVNGLIGRAGKGKTVFALNRLMKWCAGRPLFDDWKDKDGNCYMAPTQPLKCLVIENEGAGGLFHRQVGIMLNAEGYLSEEDRYLVEQNMLVWGDGGYSGLKLDDPAKLKIVREGCEKWKPDIVFIEPFRGLWNGEENSATDMAVVVDAMVEIASDYQCAVLVSHHERKSGVGEDGEKMSAGRGSTVLEGAVTVMENFQSVKADQYREVSCSKSRHGATYPSTRLEWSPEAWWYNHVPEDALASVILEAIENSPEPMALADLSEATDETKNKLRPVAEQLVKDSRLIKMASVSDGRGSTGARYALARATDPQGGLPV